MEFLCWERFDNLRGVRYEYKKALYTVIEIFI